MELLETMAGFLIQTTGTLKLEDDLKTTNWLRRMTSYELQEVMEAQLNQQLARNKTIKIQRKTFTIVSITL